MQYFTGGHNAVYYTTDTVNAVPDAVSYKLVPGVASFQMVSHEAEEVTGRNSETGDQFKLVGDITIPNLELVFNFSPDDLAHKALKSAMLAGTLLQFKIVSYSDAAHTEAYSQIVNARVLKYSFTGDKSSIVQINVTLGVSGKVIFDDVEA